MGLHQAAEQPLSTAWKRKIREYINTSGDTDSFRGDNLAICTDDWAIDELQYGQFRMAMEFLGRTANEKAS